MITQNIRETIEQIRAEELNRYKKSLKGCESIIAEEITQGFIEKLVSALEQQVSKKEQGLNALAVLFAVTK
jgi:glutamyl-tRNA reductase